MWWIVRVRRMRATLSVRFLKKRETFPHSSTSGQQTQFHVIFLTYLVVIVENPILDQC